MRGGRLVLVWRVTERCDTACPFCAYDARLPFRRRDADASEALRFGGLAADWAAARGRELLVAWLGGEPFLWPPLAEVSRELRGRGARIALTSNGRALRSARRLDFALDCVDELTLSLDGPPALHDALRGAGSAAGVLEALRALRRMRGKARAPLLRVNTVVMRGNLDRLAELAALVAGAGADELTFNALGGRDRPDFFAANRLRPEDVARLDATLRALRGGP